MGLLPKGLNMKINLFSKEKKTLPNIQFGRYSDAYKDAAQYAYWDKAVLLFEQQQYMAACESLFDYLYDSEEENVSYKRDSEQLWFEMLQGSKKITGSLNNEHFTAEIDVVKCDQLTLPFMRRLMEMNFDFQFCRFALKEQTVYLKYDTQIADALPEKLYFALREMATQADKYDDLFIATFEHVLPSQNTTFLPINPQEQSIKQQYMKLWISHALDLAHRLDHHTQAVAVSYILLNTALKIDYLIVPQGKIADKIEFINEVYYGDNTTPILERNSRVMRELNEIQHLSPDEINQELYQVRATFGLASYAQPLDALNTIQSILNDIAQCNDRRYPAIALHITECAIQYALFHLGMPPCLQQYLHFMVHCLNNDYFNALGFDNCYIDPANSKVDTKGIKQHLNHLQKNAQANFPNFAISNATLNFKTQLDFIHSLLQALAITNYKI